MSVTFTDNDDCARATPDVIDAFEREHAIVLPDDYRAFLTSTNGGSPRACLSRFPQGNGDLVAFVYGIHQGIEWKRLEYAIDSFGPNVSAFLPVAVSNGGNYFLLGLVEPHRGAIYFWDHELEESNPPSFNSILRVSSSFTSWLNSLENTHDESG